MNDLYQSYNPNPRKSRVGDCTIRAICKATGKPWDEVYHTLGKILSKLVFAFLLSRVGQVLSSPKNAVAMF